MAYRLAIFDFDGTLADSFPWFVSVLNGVAERYNFKRTEPDEIESLRHLSAQQLMRHLGVSKWKLPFITRHVRQLAARDIEKVPLFHGVERMLHHLHEAGVQVAVVSSNAEATIRKALGPDISALIDDFACRASAFGKPAKLRKVLKTTRTSPKDAITIGDEIRDYEAARTVGVAFGAVSWGFTHPAALSARAPEAVFASPDDIVSEILGRSAAA